MSPTNVKLSDIFTGIEIPEELNENYVEFVEKEEVAFDNYDIFRYASGY